LSDKIDVFLLAAGESSRMFPLSQIMEKSLLPVDGKPVIRHIVDKLKKSKNIDQIYIAVLVKHLKQFKHEFRDLKKKVTLIPLLFPKGTAVTLYDAANGKARSEWVLVHYADCMLDLNYDELINTLEFVDSKTHGVIAVTGKIKHDYSEVTVIGKAHGLGRVAVFKEKPEIASLTWTGVGLFRIRKLMEHYIGLPESDIAFDVFPQMIEETALKAHVFDGYWFDVGNLNSYRKVCSMFNGESTTKSSIC
jgi:glucose-1-phosphate thymidylyltransferase